MCTSITGTSTARTASCSAIEVCVAPALNTTPASVPS